MAKMVVTSQYSPRPEGRAAKMATVIIGKKYSIYFCIIPENWAIWSSCPLFGAAGGIEVFPWKYWAMPTTNANAKFGFERSRPRNI